MIGAVPADARHHCLMVRLFVFLAAAELVLVVLALISVLSVDRVRNLPRFLWVLVIFVIPLLGSIAYFLYSGLI